MKRSSLLLAGTTLSLLMLALPAHADRYGLRNCSAIGSGTVIGAVAGGGTAAIVANNVGSGRVTALEVLGGALVGGLIGHEIQRERCISEEGREMTYDEYCRMHGSVDSRIDTRTDRRTDISSRRDRPDRRRQVDTRVLMSASDFEYNFFRDFERSIDDTQRLRDISDLARTLTRSSQYLTGEELFKILVRLDGARDESVSSVRRVALLKLEVVTIDISSEDARRIDHLFDSNQPSYYDVSHALARMSKWNR